MFLVSKVTLGASVESEVEYVEDDPPGLRDALEVRGLCRAMAGFA